MWKQRMCPSREKGHRNWVGVTATAPTLREAIDRAYANADRVTFANAYCRRDIGQRALQAD